MIKPSKKHKSENKNILGGSGISRSDFLKYAGVSAATLATLGIAGCDNRSNPINGMGSGRLAVSSMSPEMGAPGTVVTIKGSNFAQAASQNTVMFGDKKAEVKSATNNQLKVIVPEGMATGKKFAVTVIIKGNSASCTTKFTVTLNDIIMHFGSGDLAILNYAYALEQLEAAFYTNVHAKCGKTLSAFEITAAKALRDHEITHAMWFKAVLGKVAKDTRLPSLAGYLDFSSVDFNDKQSVLKTAHALEETGVGAYNGVGPLLKNKAYLTEAGKIVSVEARHAAVVNLLLKPNSAYFAEDRQPDTGFGVDKNGLGQAFTVQQVLKKIEPFISDKITLKPGKIGG